MQVIATVRLAPGQVGFYDDLTRIHLTIQNPEKHVLSGHNTSNIKIAVGSKRLLLVSGSLNPTEAIAATPALSALATEPVAEVKEELKADPTDSVVSETIDIPVHEIKKEEAPEAIVSEKIADEAVTDEKVADAVVPDAEPVEEVIADETVTEDVKDVVEPTVETEVKTTNRKKK